MLIATDLYREIGGGQTVYKKIIESTPDVDFYYFREREPGDVPKPKNAFSILLSVRLKLRVLSAPPFPAYRRYQLEDADRFARAVAGQQFDIVDIPDYFSFGSYLRDAFDHHQVKVSRIVLAMHGNISVSLEMGWGSGGDNVLEQRMLERDQFASADGAYAISPRYIREWQTVVNRPIRYINPLCFVDINPAISTQSKDENQKPGIFCIGRTERRKGNDLFVELVRWLNPAAYGQAAHIGDEMSAPWGVSTSHILWDIAKKRDIKLDFLPSLDRQGLTQLFRQRSVVILPVRYDTLNLVALEAIFQGCPVAISAAAGVCDYLDETFPGLPYIKIDFNNFYAAASRINDLLENYDAYRKQLEDYVSDALPGIKTQLNMRFVYGEVLGTASRAFDAPRPVIPYVEHRQTLEARAGRMAEKMLPLKTYRRLVSMVGSPKAHVLRWLEKSEYVGDARFLATLFDSRFVPDRLKRIAEHSEYSQARLGEKLGEIYGNSSNPLHRCNFWLDIARIERIRGNDLVAVTYELRALRLVGRDAFGALPRIIETLRKNRLDSEADAASAMYQDEKKAPARVYEYLKKAYQRNLAKADLPLERLDDRRSGSPTVAVIVSLYKAASKLNVFLTTLCEQTLAKKGKVEFIFVDSGSPDNEYEVLRNFLQTQPMNAVYARSAERETIQAAWNRGIALSKAPYLVFLGVDETLYPEALDTLAAELDSSPDVDWVMSNSLVTAVDAHGVYKNDVMTYDRTGATKDHVYLETCYLSWVGGMYRRSIHERFGYYDETFSAAGDTEFKNRILPQINVRFLPKTLGLFLNYPDERTTASPRAEIEDLRAWYAHRTAGGIRYAFETRPVADAESLLAATFGYRKSYCGHLSSDIEYGAYLADYIGSRGAFSHRVAEGLTQVLADMRGIEYTATPKGRVRSVRDLAKVWQDASRIQSVHSTVAGAVATPCYKVFNDNRYEQHSWLWKTV